MRADDPFASTATAASGTFSRTIRGGNGGAGAGTSRGAGRRNIQDLIEMQQEAEMWLDEVSSS